MYVLLSQRIRHSYCSDLLKFMPDQESPRLYPGYRNSQAKENSAWRAHAWSRLIRYKEKSIHTPALGASCHIRAGTKKIPRNKFYQIDQSGMPLHSVPSRPGIKKRSRSVVAAGPLQDGDYLLSHLRSTIGVTKLNFSVRNGKRWDLTAITTW